MREELDMIPIIFFKRDRSEEVDWEESPTHKLMDIEYPDTGIVNLNIIGHRKDYQVQFKLSAFLKLLKARGIPLEEV